MGRFQAVSMNGIRVPVLVVILVGAAATVVAERIQKAVEALSLKRKITVSIGIAKCTTHNMNRYELIQRADIALLKAKKAGKNLVLSAG